ncbi:MAG TPA: phage portal protein [Aurantimonas coralicida]|nr:phage portal protein [Aurantimonas coralicida]
MMNPNCYIGRVTFKPGFQPGASASKPLPAYDAGAGTSRRQSSWLATSSGVNTALIGHVATLRNRARDQIRKNPWAGQIISSFVANAIGTGIKPKSKHPREAVRETLHAAWLDWTDESDTEGVGNFYAQQALVVRGLFESGETFVRLRPRRLGEGPEVPLQLQVIEADHVPLFENRLLPGRNIVIAGVEFDAQGRRVAYHMYREHPGEFLSARPRGLELERVPAAEILHVFERQRPGQVRGAPRLAAVLARLHDLDQYEDAELVRKKVTALFAGFITPGLDVDHVPLVERAPDKDGWEAPAFEPGLMSILPAGSEITFAAPAEVGTTYDPFMKWNLRAAAAGAGVTYEQATGDLSDVNFSSIRAGLLEFRRGIEQFQQATPVRQLNRPVWRLWLEQAALAGVIDASDFLADRGAYQRVQWIGQGWQWVDPEKEQKAAVREIRAGMTSRARVIAARGDDIEEIDREIAEDKKRGDGLGLVLDSDPSAVSLTGATQAKPAGSALPDPTEEAAVLNPPEDAPEEKEGEEE